MISQKELIIDFIKSKDFVAKVICLLLAVMLWVYISTQGESELAIRVKAEIKNLSSEYVVSDIQKMYVTVKIRGNSEDIEAVNKKNIRAFLDLKEPKVNHTYRYNVDLVVPPDLPKSVTLKLMDTRMFATVEEKISKTVYVVPETSGKVSPGFQKGNITVQPDRVTIYGANNQIQNIDVIKTMPLSVANATESIHEAVPLDMEGYTVSGVSDENVMVTVQVINMQNVIDYEQTIELFGKMENYNYDIIPDKKIKVYIKTSDKSVPRIEHNDIRVWTDLSNIDSTQFITKDGREVSSLRVTSRVRAIINKKVNSAQIIAVVPDTITIRVKK
ncbi:MAG: CdaR family protein [Spirochaetes bacterium]|jgi:YbbR domain-containing protein|nr:CdaR family protein [Spirochaetota bacterium]